MYSVSTRDTPISSTIALFNVQSLLLVFYFLRLQKSLYLCGSFFIFRQLYEHLAVSHAFYVLGVCSQYVDIGVALAAET